MENSFQQTRDSRKTLWRTWAALVLSVVLLQSWTIGLSPTVWEDEVEMIEPGRILLEPGSSWTVSLGGDLKPVPMLSFFGPLLSELAYRVAGGSFLGPRVLNLLAAAVCSGFIFSWLMHRGTRPGIALVVALLVLIDPCFDRSYRGGRMDAVVFLTVIAACWLVAASPDYSATRRKWMLFGAGLLCGILPWLWITGILLAPLIAVEMWRVIYPRAGVSLKTWCMELGPVVIGALITLIGLALPVLDMIYSALEATFHHVRWDSNDPDPGAAGGAAGLLPAVLYVVRYSPFLPVLAVLGGLARGNRLLFLAAILVIVVVAGTRFYLYRYLYVLPYMAVLAAGGLTSLSRLPLNGWRRKLAIWVPAGAAVLWAMLLTFGVRNFVALQEKPWRDHATLVSVMDQEIGRGPIKVYMGAFDLYYTGRQLGWAMYRNKFPLPEAQKSQIYDRCDVVLLVYYEDKPEARIELKRLGFDDGTTVQITQNELPAEFQKPRYGSMAYGPYRVYRKVIRATANEHGLKS